MKSKLGNLYVEQQSFFTWWLVLLLLLIAGASCFAAWASLGSEASIAALVGVGVVFAVAILLFSTRLRSRIDAKGDRKSTRLNSSHVKISYAVFCLKKKKK